MTGATPVNSVCPTNLVWLKRDLRLTDHAPLAEAAARPEPLLLVYCFEPELLKDPHYDERHWRFIWQSLDDLDQVLKPLGGKVHRLWGSMVPLLEQLHRDLPLAGLYSHEETGLALSPYCVQLPIALALPFHSEVRKRVRHGASSDQSGLLGFSLPGR